MKTLEDYLLSPPSRPSGMRLRLLANEEALADADLLEVRHSLGSNAVGLLFDTRQALHIQDGNTALLLIRGLRSINCDDQTESTVRLSWKITSAHFRRTPDGFGVAMSFNWPGALTAEGNTAELYIGMIDGLSEAPPDYVHDDEVTIVSDLPTWTRSFKLLGHDVFDGLPDSRGS